MRKGECITRLGYPTSGMHCTTTEGGGWVVLYLDDKMLVHCVSNFFPFCAVKSVLKDFRELFIECMDANVVIYDLEDKDILTDGDIKVIEKTAESNQQNQILYDRLLRKCTVEALMTVCDKIIAVRGNPKMKKLGEDMKSKLSGKLCVRVCHVCM